MFKIVIFDSQESRESIVYRGEEGTFMNLGLAAAQCNGIAACAYLLKTLTVHTLLYLTVHGL